MRGLYNPGGFLGGQAVPRVPVLNAQQAGMLAGQVLKNEYDYVLFDTQYFKSGAAIPSTPIRFFGNQMYSQQFLVNDATVSFSKQKFMTNLVKPGELPRGQLFKVGSIEAIVTVPGNFDLTNQSTGNTALPSTLPTFAVTTAATAGVVATNLAWAVLTMSCLNLRIGEGHFEQGPLIQFPSQFGLSGYAGNSFTGTAQAGIVVANEAAVNNGFGRCRPLTSPREIENGTPFWVDVDFPIGFTPSRNFQIQICLVGKIQRDVA